MRAILKIVVLSVRNNSTAPQLSFGPDLDPPSTRYVTEGTLAKGLRIKFVDETDPNGYRLTQRVNGRGWRFFLSAVQVGAIGWRPSRNFVCEARWDGGILVLDPINQSELPPRPMPKLRRTQKNAGPLFEQSASPNTPSLLDALRVVKAAILRGDVAYRERDGKPVFSVLTEI